MAFIGLFGVMFALFILMLNITVFSIIIGTILKKKTKHIVLGTTLRILGFVLIAPVAIFAIMFIILFIK